MSLTKASREKMTTQKERSKKNSPLSCSAPLLNLALAPMVRISALGFRELCSSYGADIVFSEEVVASKLATCQREVVHYPEVPHRVVEFVCFEPWKNKWKRVVVFSTLVRNGVMNPSSHLASSTLDNTSTETRCNVSRSAVVLQLGVADPEIAKRAVQVLQRGDVQGIDLNMGCPKRFSVSNGFGAALMKKTVLAGTILRSIYDVLECSYNRENTEKDSFSLRTSTEKDAVKKSEVEHFPIWISFKTRLCATPIETYQMLREILLSAAHSPESGVYVVQRITLHARFVDQRSETPPHYNLAQEAVAHCKQDVLFSGIRFCLNGSLSSKSHAQGICNKYGFVDGMLGRSALLNPRVFSPLFSSSVVDMSSNKCSSNASVHEDGAPRLSSYAEQIDILLEMWEYAVRYQTSFANFKFHMTRLIPEIPALKYLMPRIQSETRQYLDFLPIFFFENKGIAKSDNGSLRYSKLRELEKACHVETIVLDEPPRSTSENCSFEESLPGKRMRSQMP